MKNQPDSIAYIALIGTLWFTISSVYLQYIRVDLDVVKETLSIYAIGEHGYILESGFYAIGLSQIIIAYILFKNNISNRINAIALCLAGLGVLIVGIMPVHIEPVELFVKLSHIVGATMQFVFFPAAVLLLFKSIISPALRRYTLFSGVTTTFLFLLIAILFLTGFKNEINYFGLIEKLDIYVINMWLIVVAWQLRRSNNI